jgi:hypothetical protein
MKHARLSLYTLLLAYTLPNQAQDLYHYYRASPFFGEPRLEKPWLSTLELSAFTGSTSQAKNCATATVPLFDMYGIYNMRLLGSGVPDKDPTNLADIALINLAQTPANGCYAHVSFPGCFKVIEGVINFTQNFSHGVFGQVYIPIRNFTIRPGRFIDLSPAQTEGPTSINTPQWQNFLAQFNAILARYDLSIAQRKVTNVGAVSLELGWTYNYQETEILDFVDTTIKTGILLGTGTERNPNYVFDISTGYDKHIGIPVTLDMSLGLYEWFTGGIHAGAIGFINRTQNVRMKTDVGQSGMIKLAQGRATVSMGPIWDMGLYAKADHLNNLMSILVGYTFARKECDSICPLSCDGTPSLFDPEIVNTDPQYAGWQMNTINFLLELDFTRENRRLGPRLGFIYNLNAGGKRVFKNNTAGGYVGLDVAWCY